MSPAARTDTGETRSDHHENPAGLNFFKGKEMIGNRTGRQVCEECNIQFPKHCRYVAPFCIKGVWYDLCTICALKLIRKLNYVQYWYFNGKANRKKHKRTVEFLSKAGVEVPAELGVQTF